MDRMHDVKYMIRQVAVGAMWPSCSQRLRHVCHADAPAIFGMSMLDRLLLPFCLARPMQDYRRAKRVWIRQDQRAFRAKHFHATDLTYNNIKACYNRPDHAIRKIQHTRDMRRSRNGDHGPVQRLARNHTLRTRNLR